MHSQQKVCKESCHRRNSDRIGEQSSKATIRGVKIFEDRRLQLPVLALASRELS